MLQVEPFRPWEEQAAQDCGLSDTPTMQVCCDACGRAGVVRRGCGKLVKEGWQELLRRSCRRPNPPACS